MFLTQKEFAELLGVSISIIGKWERGINKPALRTQRKLMQICKANGVEVYND